jgi:hypothetical protein
LKSKLADEEHKNAALAFTAEEHLKDIVLKNAAFASLQEQNYQLKSSATGASVKKRMLENEIQVRFDSLY